jgi:hypothetical protein
MDSWAQSQQRAGIVRRVQFAAGHSSTVISGEAPLGVRDTYIFHASKGQMITGDVIWQGDRNGNDDDEGLSGFIFVEPDGKNYKDPQDFSFVAKVTGDYRVVVRAPYKMNSYKYRFELAIAKGSGQTDLEDPKQAANTGDAQGLKKYVGKYPRELLKNEPAITKRLKVLLGKSYDLFELNMGVQSPIKLDEGALIMEGMAPHSMDGEAHLVITLSDGKLHCAILSNDFGRKFRVFSEDPKHLPATLKDVIE